MQNQIDILKILIIGIKFINIFSKVTPNCEQTVTEVTVCNLVGPPELSLYKKYNKFYI